MQVPLKSTPAWGLGFGREQPFWIGGPVFRAKSKCSCEMELSALNDTITVPPATANLYHHGFLDFSAVGDCRKDG